MKEKLIYALIDEKNISSDVLTDFMQSYTDYSKGAIHSLIGAPIWSNKPYVCQWNHNNNWVRFTPVEAIWRGDIHTNRKLCEAFVRFVEEGNEGNIKLLTQVTDKEVWANFYFIDK